MATKITVETTVNAPVEKAWKIYTTPKHVMQWNNASDDWHTPSAQNDLKKGGKFVYRMEAKDKSTGFDFGGTYTEIKPNQLIAYTMGDERKVTVSFDPKGKQTKVKVTFDAETTNSLELQQKGWQAILDNYKKYVEEA